jgi:PBSX family phage terminase large subunit
MKFILDDNPFNSPRFVDELKKEYKGTVYYDRFILGEWKAAEGAIYRLFADSPKNFITDKTPENIIFANIGVDFGGNKSATTFCCTGFTRNLQQIVVLDEHKLSGINSPEKINTEFIDFCKKNKAKYKIVDAFCDSAEQTLIQGMKVACIKAKVPIEIRNALKGEINGRIRFLNSMIGQNRFFVMGHCKNTINSLQSAVWDNKSITDKRLDNGTYDVDSEDALHYSFEKYMKDIQAARLFK